ncbi:hypothetical protein [uncultured Shewanella sp.]|uniref:hypothetical protein n=1 Tax=uncultured Shewanella sp. TaxID=173975 RepID=UPI002613D52F|nr:hypothetical protein [uncultured Shewanella sp.]
MMNRLHDGHVVAYQNHILDTFINSVPAPSKTVNKADNAYSIVWHRAFWVEPYIYAMKTFCLICGVTYERKMVVPLIKHGVHLEKVNKGEKGNSPFSLKNYSIRFSRLVFSLPYRLVSKI